MKKFINPKNNSWKSIINRPVKSSQDLEYTVKSIFKEVQERGDFAVKKYTEFFDYVSIENPLVSEAEIALATNSISSKIKNAIAQAKSNIERFHSAQITSAIEVETTTGVLCWQKKTPIQKVGLYIPGGSAPLFSTVLMLAIPAKIAGCQEIILCTPPDKNGQINPAILYTAALCGVSKIYKVGGIQAIAAMTFGTDTIPKTFKIFGPGNQFVAAAKQYATQFGMAVDLPAGPSELLVFADQTGIPEFIASDLLSQAEHGEDSQVILVTNSKNILNTVTKEIKKQLDVLPRKEIAAKALENSKIVWFENKKEITDFINEYAPEHLMIISKEESYFIDRIVNAGSVFLGNYTPESAGDYASGTNHTLPTNGFAKNFSGVTLDSFLKTISYQKINETGIQTIGKTIEIMAEAEGLQAHKNAVSVRLRSLKKIRNGNN